MVRKEYLLKKESQVLDANGRDHHGFMGMPGHTICVSQGLTLSTASIVLIPWRLQMLGVGLMQAFIAVSFTIPTFTFNDCCNEALMNEFDNSWKQTTTEILRVLGNTFLVAFILYPMIIPGSISVIGLDMMWDPDTDSQSLSMSGFSYMLQQNSQQQRGLTNQIKQFFVEFLLLVTCNPPLKSFLK